MKINLNRLYVGDIMVGASSLTDDNKFGDNLIISKKDYLDIDGGAELLLLLGETQNKEIFIPIKWIRGEHHLSIISKDVDKYIKNDTSQSSNYDNKISIIYNVSGRYITDVKQLFKNNTKQAYLRDLKLLRETIKNQSGKQEINVKS